MSQLVLIAWFAVGGLTSWAAFSWRKQANPSSPIYGFEALFLASLTLGGFISAFGWFGASLLVPDRPPTDAPKPPNLHVHRQPYNHAVYGAELTPDIREDETT